jgi:hypothetical protein
MKDRLKKLIANLFSCDVSELTDEIGRVTSAAGAPSDKSP